MNGYQQFNEWRDKYGAERARDIALGHFFGCVQMGAYSRMGMADTQQFLNELDDASKRSHMEMKVPIYGADDKTVLGYTWEYFG